MNLTASRPGPSSLEEKDAVNVSTTNEDEQFLIDLNVVRSINVDVEGVIESALQTFEEENLGTPFRRDTGNQSHQFN